MQGLAVAVVGVVVDDMAAGEDVEGGDAEAIRLDEIFLDGVLELGRMC